MRPSSTQSHLRFPLTQVLGNGGQVRVLRILSNHGGALSVSQIVRESGLTPQGTRGVLRTLVEQGVVQAHGERRSVVFSSERNHPVSDALRQLFAVERSSWDAFLRSLRRTVRRFPEVQAAWLYGSVARGEDGPQSDVDIAVLLDRSSGADAIREALTVVGDRWRTAISVLVLDRKRMRAMPANDPLRLALMRDARVLKGAPPNEVFAGGRTMDFAA